jgi:hypothetical protein
MATDLKTETLAYALARARAFVVDRANHPSVTDGFQEFARGLLADIDRALEGTIFAPPRVEETE